jgi:chemosensory pili system protein ChpC
MTQDSSVVRSVVVPLDREVMLLPGSVIAEVVAYGEPAPAPAGAPGWLVGIMNWREQRVPLVSLGAFMSGTPGVIGGGSSRIAVIKALGDRSGFSFYGIVTGEIPLLATVSPENIEPNEGAGVHWPGVVAEALVNGEPMIIPDLDAIEAALREALLT